MQIIPNKIMQSFRSFGVSMKAFFLGEKSLVRDLTKGDEQDRFFSAQGIQTLKTKDAVNKLMISSLRKWQQDGIKTPLLRGQNQPYHFEGSLISVMSASKHMQVEDITEFAKRVLAGKMDQTAHINPQDRQQLFKEAFQELISELRINRKGNGNEYIAPDLAWVQRAQKLLQSCPEILDQQIPASFIPGAKSKTDLTSETYKDFFKKIITHGTQLVDTIDKIENPRAIAGGDIYTDLTGRPFVADSGPVVKQQPLIAAAKLPSLPPGSTKQYLFASRQWDRQYIDDPAAQKVSRDIDKELSQRTYQAVTLPPGDSAYADIPLINHHPLGVREGSYLRPIHANQVELFQNHFIIAQMPTPSQRDRFLKVIFQQEIPFVIDLTEPGKEKFIENQKYYSTQTGRMPSDPIQVKKLTEPKEKNGLIIEKYSVVDKQTGQSKEFTRVNYPRWKDHGALKTPADLNQLVTAIDEYVQQARAMGKTPMIHCNAGIGRSGTIATALTLYHLSKERTVNLEDLVKIVVSGRSQRGPYFVQTPDQLRLLVRYVEYLSALK